MKLQLVTIAILSATAASSFAYPDAVIVNNLGGYSGSAVIDSEFARLERQEPSKSQNRTVYKGNALLESVNARLSNGLNASLEQGINSFDQQRAAGELTKSTQQ